MPTNELSLMESKQGENPRSLESVDNDIQGYEMIMTFENHYNIWTQHEIEVGGVLLKERKETIQIKDENQADSGPTEIKYFRSIDAQTITIRQQIILTDDGEEVEGKRQIEANMDDSEVASFLKLWEELWNPKLSNERVEEIIQTPAAGMKKYEHSPPASSKDDQDENSDRENNK